MHSSFEIFRENKNTVDNIIQGIPKFSQVFLNLFPADGDYSESMKSYLNLLGDFQISEDLLREPTSNDIVTRLYERFEIPIPVDNDGVYQFWVFLVQMHQSLITDMPTENETQRPKFDNIFAFMNDFPVQQTRVVIIGIEPSMNVESLGYAFNGSFCNSTKVLVENFIQNDLQHLNTLSRTVSEAKLKYGFKGWLEQGVLLFNTFLTFKGQKEKWTDFTKFVVRQLSLRCDCLVFLLAGWEPTHCFEDLIDKNKHAVFNLYHPNCKHQTDPNKQWEQQLPFLNANYYFSQKNHSEFMVDWIHLKKGSSRNRQLTKYTTCFETVDQDTTGELPVRRESIPTGTNTYSVLKKNA